MGLYFRKSKSVGPFRLNFSKSGLGVSTGVKGARVSFGPRGTYINVGRNGIYYRKKIGGASGQSKHKRINANSNSTVPYRIEDSDITVDAIKIPTSSGQITESGKEIIKNVKRACLCTWIWWILLFVLFYYLQGWAIVIMLLLGVAFRKFFRAEINYELDDETREKWNSVVEQLALLKSSKKIWIVEASSINSNAKVNAGATRSISRGNATVKVIKQKRGTRLKITTNEKSFLISSSKCKILFLPSEVIIKKGGRTIAYAYGDINIICSTTNFIEDGAKPRDAEIIRYTWQYVNKDGSADRRYNNNRQLPVCKYGLLHFKVGNELNIEIHVSNNRIMNGVGNVCRNYAGFFNANSMRKKRIEQSKGTFISERDFASGNLDGLFENEVVHEKEAKGSLMEEFNSFMNIEDNE